MANEKIAKSRGTGGAKRVSGRGRGFVLRYLLSLVFGWVFAVALIKIIYCVAINIGPYGFFTSVRGYGGLNYLMLLLVTSVVFGVLHLVLAWSVDKRPVLDKGAEKYTKVFGTIYRAGLALMAIGHAMIVSYLLLGAAVIGLESWEWPMVAEGIVTFAIIILVLLVMRGYQMRMFARWPRWVYPTVMGLVGIVTIGLFLVFPVSEIRDEKITSDIRTIELAIDDYVRDHGRLPSGLDALTLKDLNRDVSKYGFRQRSKEDGHYLEYMICTDGFSASGSAYLGNIYSDWTRGHNCFDMEVWGDTTNVVITRLRAGPRL